MFLHLLKYIFVIVFNLAFLSAQAESLFNKEPGCFPKNTFDDSQNRDLYAANCVAQCTQLYKKNDADATSYFTKNCQEFFDNRNRSTNLKDASDAAIDILNKALLQCLPLAGYKAVTGIVDMVKMLPQLVGYLLTSANNSESAKARMACAKSEDCRKAVAANTIRYQNLTDQELAKLSFNDLMTQAQHDLPLIKNECLNVLSQKRKAIASDGEEWTVQRHQKVFAELAQEFPRCPGALRLVPPSLEAAAKQARETITNDRAQAARPPPPPGYADQNECLQKNPSPLSCLPILNRLATAWTCTGSEFKKEFDKTQVDICSDIVSFFIPIPVVATGSTIMRAGSKGLKAVQALKSESSVATTASEVSRATGGERTLAHSSELSGGPTELSDKPHSLITKTPSKSEAKQLSPAEHAAQTRFISEYKAVDATTEPERKRFDALVADTSPAAQRKTFLYEDECTATQNINTQSKELATSLTNFRQTRFLENIKDLSSKYPDTPFTIEKYHDYKTVRVALRFEKNISPELEARILKDFEAASAKTQEEFLAEVKRLSIDVPQAGNPADWFKQGYGRSLAESSAMARDARTHGPSSREEVRERLTEKLKDVEAQRQALAESPQMSSLMEKNSQGVALPRADVFDLVRKNKSPEDLATAISRRYQLKNFSTDDAKQLQSYAQGVDSYSPPLLIMKREKINFDEAGDGGASADFLGMGAANARATAEAIAQKTSLDEAFQAARQGEKNVTKDFLARKEAYKKTVGGEVICSGDDCVRVGALTYQRKVQIMSQLANNSKTRQIRQTFFGPNVPVEQRVALTTHGEGIERTLRQELSGVIGEKKLQSITFGFDMQTTKLNQGQVDLIVGKKTFLYLSPKEKQEINAAFARALEKYNANVKNYKQGSATSTQKTLLLVPVPSRSRLSTESPEKDDSDD